MSRTPAHFRAMDICPLHRPPARMSASCPFAFLIRPKAPGQGLTASRHRHRSIDASNIETSRSRSSRGPWAEHQTQDAKVASPAGMTDVVALERVGRSGSLQRFLRASKRTVRFCRLAACQPRHSALLTAKTSASGCRVPLTLWLMVRFYARAPAPEPLRTTGRSSCSAFTKIISPGSSGPRCQVVLWQERSQHFPRGPVQLGTRGK